ncbi:MAG: tRNA uridine-5-carboxymethylaminomethyl(34) synthesis GTPase MnmE [Gammaproteobacteria bacterium]|nr:tRNA uridine-5-carboxymethylaminomethyl(34) synthesis GTPase MnmE [Gammaproteobacteria bacterium]
MSATDIDTIAAQATPSGRGGVGIIRVSGPMVRDIAIAVLGRCPLPRYAEYLRFHDQEHRVIDEGIALFFPTPHSFTGEDVLELQGHGGPVVMDLLLQTVIACGARLARPGEFSERAFLNDKLDLAQAEAIADLIDAGSDQAARSALRSLQGEFSHVVHALVAEVTRLRVYVEASLDFPEEEIDFLSAGNVSGQITDLIETLDSILRQAQQGSLLKEGIRLVLAGQPNAGKSSLLNALARREAAIVTEIPGTTRDVIREEIHLDGLPVHIIDTAGLRESVDVVEQEGIRRTWQAIEQADGMLLIIDDRHGVTAADEQILSTVPAGLPVIRVHNKIDISGRPAGIIAQNARQGVAISAKQGLGLEQLVDAIKDLAGFRAAGEGTFMARRRHLHALERASLHLQQAYDQSRIGQAEFVAEELKAVQDRLGEITGEVSSDDLLGEIFSQFCIGK